jgi:CO/xanthine dehydrogenase Mo-binding subunit
VESSDTNLMPWDLGTHGSRNTFVTGNAVEGASRKLLARMLDVAAEMLEARADDLVAAQGTVFVRGAAHRSVTIADVAKAAHYRHAGAQLMVEHFYDPPTEQPGPDGKGNKSAAYAFGFHGAEVEVDEETGEVRVVRYVAAHDIGCAINPKGVEGQVEGGVAQGLGFTLFEDMFADDGQTLMASLQDYKIPVALDVPDALETILVEARDPAGPYGAKGVAEPAIIPVAPAIVNAIANAVGVRVRDLPATPEKILRALAARRGSA